MTVSERELDLVFETALTVGEETIAATEAAKIQPPTGGTEALDKRVQSTVALIDEAAVVLPMEKSLQLLDLRVALTGTSDEVIEPLHTFRGLMIGLLWSRSLWLVIIAVALWIVVLAGIRF